MRDVRIDGKADNVAFVKWMFDVRNDNFRMLIRASGSGTYDFRDKKCSRKNIDDNELRGRLFQTVLAI